MLFDFDKPLSREHTNSVKFDGRRNYFGTNEVSPLWVADMDFAVPDCVTHALQARLEHPVFGYTLYPESLYQSIIDWFERKHHWKIERDWILMAPGVVPSLFAAVQAFADQGDGVIVQPPVYFPFFSAVTTNNRKLILNPLREVDGHYTMDFQHLESCAKQGAKVLMLCSPHNPVGRVWKTDELQEVLRIARQYDLTIVSDDIHADLVYSGSEHLMLGRLAEPTDKIITTIAPNKTFNIPGLGLSALVIPHAEQRKAIKKVFDMLHVSNTNPLSMVAFEAAYKHGDEWLKQLMSYLETSRNRVGEFIDQHLPGVKLVKPEATYLLWLNCKELKLTDSELRDFFVKQCRVGMNPGVVFGESGSGYMRLNIGTARPTIMEALNRITQQLPPF